MITPLFDKVLIEIEKEKDVTTTGIYIPTNEERKLEKAVVIEIGEDVTKLKPGDNILFKSYSADTITIDEKDHSFVKEEDVLAIWDTNTTTQ